MNMHTLSLSENDAIDRTVFVAMNGVKQPLLKSYEMEVLEEDAEEGILPVVFVTVEKKGTTPPKQL